MKLFFKLLSVGTFAALLAISCSKDSPQDPVAPVVPETVDLGLSVKWRSWNVGATKPEEAGIYFAFADTVGQTWTGKAWSGAGYDNYPGFVVDSENNLVSKFDAATVNLGEKWRMPTRKEIQALLDSCTCVWTDNYNGTGVKGRIFTGKKAGYTDRSIFFPVAGYGSSRNLEDSDSLGCYWSKTYDYDLSSVSLEFSSGEVKVKDNDRLRGFPIRPVTD